tara:strand:+ start:4693 stop:5370 length:678 start_codon:yes stop_codon:yes gene_type:complete
LDKKISYYNNFSKSKFSKLSLQERFELIYNENFWESNESRSGIGSEIKNTKEVLKSLDQIIKDFKIKSIIDIPCGDFNWMSFMDMKNIEYQGHDIVEQLIIKNNKKFKKNNISFFNSDITNSRLGKADLMFVRDCLVHFSIEDIKKSIFRIKQSRSKYLMSTSFVNVDKNLDIYSADWRPINLEKEPFNFPKPLLTYNEKCQEMGGIYDDKSLCLWKINKLPDLK